MECVFVFLLCFWLCWGEMGERKVSGMLRLQEQRVNIKFLCAAGKTPIECWRSLNDVYRPDAASKSTIRYWHQRFRGGDTNVQDKPRAGRPLSSCSHDTVERVRMTMEADRRRSVRSVAEEVGINRTSAHQILRKNLKMTKVCAKFVQRILTPELKQMRMQLCELNLDMLRKDPYLIDKIVTGDESWVPVFNPETKASSAQWKKLEEPRPQKSRRSRCVRKTMLTCFYDSTGPILNHFTEMGHTTDTEAYCEILNQLKERIRKKRPLLWRRQNPDDDRPFYLLHDNASSHTATITLALLGESGIQMINHPPPYSPDLAPCDFFLFPTLKAKLRGTNHRNVVTLEAAIRRELAAIPSEIYSKSLEELPIRWQKCVAAQGDYFEGMHLPVEYDLVVSEDSDDAHEEETGA